MGFTEVISGRTYIRLLVILYCLMNISCKPHHGSGQNQSNDPEQNLLIKKRDDGTLSSVNQIDAMGIVHGLRVTYYPDGKTVYSKLTLEHGIKNGPFVRFYKNGQVYEYTGYKDGKKHGHTRKYYKDGSLLAEFEYREGIRLPGLKEYHEDGTLVSEYPEILFEQEDHLQERNRLDLRIYSSPAISGIKYYLKQGNTENESRIYLISEKGSALIQHFVKPGDLLSKRIEIIAEIPTELGNVLVKHLSYNLRISNPY